MARPRTFVVQLASAEDDLSAEVYAPVDGAFTVEVDGTRLEVLPGPGGRYLVRDDAGTQRIVTLDTDGTNPQQASVDGITHAIQVQSPDQIALAAALGNGAGGAGSGLVKAPMPGRVVRVLVGPGETVTAGTPVVIVEAMKMENELAAPFDAEVVSLSVADGDAVDSGATLVTLKPQD